MNFAAWAGDVAGEGAVGGTADSGDCAPAACDAVHTDFKAE
jgi:hypothetical protein